MISAGGSPWQFQDVDARLSAASKAFFANKRALQDRHIPLHSRLSFFHAVVTPIECFAAGHRMVRHSSLQRLNVEYWPLLRSVVGPGGDVDWTAPWHEILHGWNARVARICQQHEIKDWATISLQQQWELAAYITSLPQKTVDPASASVDAVWYGE